MAKKRLAITDNGDLTYCSAPLERLGMGRCNHIAHQQDNETDEEFMQNPQYTAGGVRKPAPAKRANDDNSKLLQIMEYQIPKESVECKGKISLGAPCDYPMHIPMHKRHFPVSDFDKRRIADHAGVKAAPGQNISRDKNGIPQSFSTLQDVIKKRASMVVQIINPDSPRLPRSKSGEIQVRRGRIYKEPELLEWKDDVEWGIGLVGVNRYCEVYNIPLRENISVLPYELRENTPDGGLSDISILYQRVHSMNIKLGNAQERLDNMDPEDEDYEKVAAQVDRYSQMLQLEYEQLLDNANCETPHTVKGFPMRSLSSIIDGKHGLIRGQVTGLDVSYSARAVISVDSDLEFGQCRLPLEMCSQIYKPVVYDQLRQMGWTEEQIEEYHTRTKYGHPLPGDAEVMAEILERSEVKVLLNRAPSIHEGSLQSFTPLVSDTKTIKINPLVCKNFNADFDGDTMLALALHNPLLPGAESISAHNLRNTPRALDSSAIKPSKDAVWGLRNMIDELPSQSIAEDQEIVVLR